MSDNELKKLRNEVQELRDELAIMKRKYEDIIYNLDTDNFSQRVVKQGKDMYTKIEQTAEEISLQAEKIEDNEEKMAELSVKAGEISSIAKTNISAHFTLKEVPTKGNTSASQKKMLCLYTDEDGDEVYYYYNDITETWEPYPKDGLQTLFVQTPTGFQLIGDVKVDGSCILTDTLTFNTEAKPIEVQYSVNGTSDWHYDFDSSNDKFMRIKIGAQWSNAIKVVGDDGEDGKDGTNGSNANVTFAKVNSVLGNLFKTVSGGTPTQVDGSYIYSPSVLGGEFYGGAYYAGIGEGYSSMDEDGFTVNDNDGYTKIALGYDSDDYTYPYVILGAGTGYTSNGAALVYKMGNGIWIGDSSVMKYPGNCPGGGSVAGTVNTILPHATGIFIDFAEDEVYVYRNGFCEVCGSGSGSGGTNYAEFK